MLIVYLALNKAAKFNNYYLLFKDNLKDNLYL